jgi:exodeoxyribonuclease-5
MSSLTVEQKNVIKKIVKDIDNKSFVTLGGYAGTGKSTIIRVISEVLSKKGLFFFPCAYTGKAANVLRKKGINASTIHSCIYKAYKDSSGETFWNLIDKNGLTGVDGFIVDESSMVSKEIHDDLRSFDLPIIYVGDHGQLEPIGTDFNLMKNPDYCLETVHRNAGEIAYFAEHLRKGNNPLLFNAKEKVQIVQSSAVEDRHLNMVDQVICAYNKTRVELNNRARVDKKIEYNYISVGEKIICLRNNKGQGLFNGMQGIVSKVKKNYRIDFTSDNAYFENIQYNPDQFGKETNCFEFDDPTNPFDYAYCITCHKAQGDQFNNLIVYEQKCNKWNHSRWAYTAASRAVKSLVWVAADSFLPSYV